MKIFLRKPLCIYLRKCCTNRQKRCENDVDNVFIFFYNHLVSANKRLCDEITI